MDAEAKPLDKNLEQDLIEWVVNWNEGELDGDVDADTDLSSTGLLDSMALVGLVAYLEDRTGATFDFASFDPVEGTSIRRLVRHCVG
ncbi:acyl carrier protein [Streptomyces sp. NPDC048417]|uniref:acyl carrier protein n=1 Tax=unclassified Streptomyces TaxID=2593676 RepID=UPI003319D384